MQTKKYYEEVTQIIENIEVNKKVREFQGNIEKIRGYWEIGKLIVEAQKGEKRAQYGEQVIKKWSRQLAEKYGSHYGLRSLENFRKFYLLFPKAHALRTELTWTHYRYILPIKDENKRNFYINQVILNHLSSRELMKEIQNQSFERLSYADKENIVLLEEKNYQLSIKDMIKDPILLKTNKNIKELDEKALHKYIINMLENRFLELGSGFALVGHEYKIKVENHTYKIDLLFFNYELNAFVVMEVKTKANQHKDIGQLEFYVNYINQHIKKVNHHLTIGILLVEKENTFLIEYITNENIYVSRYLL